MASAYCTWLSAGSKRWLYLVVCNRIQHRHKQMPILPTFRAEARDGTLKSRVLYHAWQRVPQPRQGDFIAASHPLEFSDFVKVRMKSVFTQANASISGGSQAFASMGAPKSRRPITPNRCLPEKKSSNSGKAASKEVMVEEGAVRFRDGTLP